MKPLVGPLESLLYSRKFLLLALDTVIAVTSYFLAKYAAPGLEADVMKIVALLQPVLIMVIYAIAKEDAAEKSRVNYVMGESVSV